ncbi:hypothetical protein LTWDN19_16590 [Latilactobacillus curvatus]|uniref:Glycosyl transferase family 28 C-terminal domain-containing protein n=1 Tax=Latilactobacillus curvatus TaxID=28038 RepID=A0ABN6GKW7_LATCU|nr:PssE/Cps14G family polysaccharide biosynthesis glycosyltransferase [Latilactobacillus curvatus]BCX31092.1 hypothetical protein LTWDN19_16590 [Latilactobacillus curvatus]
MIFIVLGTQKFQFNRLLKEVDVLIQNGVITDKVFAQIGHSNYKPVNFEYRQFLSPMEFNQLIENCSLLITHSGVGTIVSGLKKRKPIIVCPRLQDYGEHVDNHQREIADDFVKIGYVLSCFDMHELSDKIEQSFKYKFVPYQSKKSNIINVIRSFIDGGVKL